KAVLSQDWKTAYPLIAFSEEGKKKAPDADAFATLQNQQINSNPFVSQIFNQLKEAAQTATVGEPVINGDKADVPTSIKMSGSLGGTYKGTAHMINEGGVWKFDLTSGSAMDTIKANIDLVGRPEGGGIGGGSGFSLPGK